jgi:hypothetical protein
MLSAREAKERRSPEASEYLAGGLEWDATSPGELHACKPTKKPREAYPLRKLITAATIVASLATLAVPAIASASVDRYQVETGTLTSHVAYGDLSSVHTYKVTINPCDNTFTGNDGSSRWAENEQITSGTINGSGSNADITFHATYPSGYSWDVASGGKGSDSENRTFQVTNVLTGVTNSTNVKNHGEYVSSQGGGSDAAHSCIGMPIH